MSAAGAGAHDIAVGEELLVFLIEVLFGDALFELAALFVHFQKESLCRCGMQRVAGAVVDIERNAQPLEGILVELVVFIDDLLRRDALLLRPHGDGGAVFVGAADKDGVFAQEAEIANIDIGRQVSADEVPQVQGPVGIGQGRRDQMAFRFTHGDGMLDLSGCSKVPSTIFASQINFFL